MLQDTASRVCGVTAFSLFITILMYMALTRVEKPSQMVEDKIYKPPLIPGWGAGWASLLAPGEPLESTTMQSPLGKFVFSIKSDGQLVFEDRKLKRNTTLFSQTDNGVHGLEDGVQVPDGATFHARVTQRGTFVVYYDVQMPLSTPDPPNESASRARRSSPTQTEDKRDVTDWEDLLRLIDEDLDVEDGDDDKNNGLGSLSTTIWDSNRLPNCHKIPKGAYPPSSPFLQLDDTGQLYISTSNEINCVLKHSEESKAALLQKP